MQMKNCEFCAKPFRTRGAKRFCSDRCRFRAWSAPSPDRVEPCTYCGVPAESVDHVPPRAYRLAILADSALRGRYPFIETPSCCECNSLLGARPLWTIKDRKRFLKGAIRKRYAKYLRIPDWEQGELRELGSGWLRNYVETGLLIREITKQRLSW